MVLLQDHTAADACTVEELQVVEFSETLMSGGAAFDQGVHAERVDCASVGSAGERPGSL